MDDEGLHRVALRHLKRRTKWVGEFKEFVLRGNMIDLAIGVVIGVAFNNVVNALVRDLITPVVSLPGTVNLERFAIRVSKGAGKAIVFSYGDFITVLINFIIIAATVFFFVVRPINLLRRIRQGEAGEPAKRPCPECLSEIPQAARRCAFCTAEVGAGS